MKLYLAAIYTSNFDLHGQSFSRLTDREKQARWEIEHILESYHYINKQSAIDKIRRDGAKIFLDSGAFSAFTKGVDIDLPGYCEYIKRNKDILYSDDGVICASVLDGIGDPLLTWQNQQSMEMLGVRPLPCFHFGEDERYLEWYMSKYDYITIGGMVPISTPNLITWLDRIWGKYLCDGAGKPRLKVHGFGLTSLKLMTRYPWYSVDSATWVQRSMNGEIMVPDIGSVGVSSKSPSRKTEGRHLRTYTPELRKLITGKIEGEGFSIARLEEEYTARWAYNVWAFPIEGAKNTKTTFEQDQLEIF